MVLSIQTSSSSVKIPTPREEEKTHYLVSQNRCDSFVYITAIIPVLWSIPPLCGIRIFLYANLSSSFDLGFGFYKFGFGKDKFNVTRTSSFGYTTLQKYYLKILLHAKFSTLAPMLGGLLLPLLRIGLFISLIRLM